MKTMMNGVRGAAILGVAMLCACTPDPAGEADSVPRGSFQPAACGGVGNEVLLLVDTSSRMGDPSGFKQGNKYLAREQLVVDALKRTLPHVKKEVDFGLLTFPWVDRKDGGNTTLCPASCEVGDVVVQPGDPYGWIVSRLEGIEIGGKAAVGAALLKARDYYAGHPSFGRSRSVVLFTAGGDTCNGDVLASIDALKAIGVETTVISFENAGDQELLAAMARHGGKESRSDPGTVKFLKPDSGIELVEDALVTSAAVEVCDGADNDCDGLTDEGFDADGDGWSICMDDCDDSNPLVYPGAREGGHSAGYAAARVSTFFQGTQKSGALVNAVSSNPAEALDFDAKDDDSVIFALGFDGFIEVEFDCPLKNGPGADLRVYEKTPAATASTETADVYAFDVVNKAWVKLGQATNLPATARPNVANDFDLGALPFANRVRIVNATAATVESGSDGFDVNGVYALQECGDCDGIDNDCSGDVDEGYNVGGTCSGTVGLACTVGGVLACDATGISAVCVFSTANVTMTAEACDGVDNDCDGLVDEALSQSCETACGKGHKACAGGAWGECAIDRPNAELCDGIDNDCDGQVDEGFDVGDECSEGQNACAVSGVKVCSADGLEAVCEVEGGLLGGGGETCNGIDDDCDGKVDDGQGLCPSGQTCFKGACVYD